MLVIGLNGCGLTKSSMSSPVDTTKTVISPNSNTYAFRAGATFLVYNNNCSKCHGYVGEGGQGPQLIGSNNFKQR